MLLDHFKDMLHEGQSLGATWIMHSDGLTIETTCEDGPASKGIVFRCDGGESGGHCDDCDRQASRLHPEVSHGRIPLPRAVAC